MAKRERTSKKQIEAMIGYIENHKKLVNPGDFSEWEELKNSLNTMDGPTRTIKQWKTVFNDLKTNARRRARQIKCELKKTGGGTNDSKPLTHIETRVLGLIEQVSIDGIESIPEPGLEYMEVNEQEVIDVDIPVILLESPVLPNVSEVCEVGDETQKTTPRKSRITPRSTRRQLQIAPSRADLQELIKSNNNIAASNNNLARSIAMLAKALAKK